MPLVVVGTLLLLAKWQQWGPVGAWSWWIVAAPFIGAVLWWQFSDASGWTKQREMNKMEERKAKRRERAVVALGGDTRREKRVDVARKEVERRAAVAKAAAVSAKVSGTEAGMRRTAEKGDPKL
jgi:small Trp-rich protein